MPDRPLLGMMTMATAKKAAPAAATTDFAKTTEAFFKGQFPGFNMPQVEFPTAYREFAEKGLSQAKQGYERAKAVAEEASEMIETTYATAAKGASTYNMKLLEAARTNTNAYFDFVGALLSVKSPTEVAELAQSHAKKQIEVMTAQGKELAALAQKVSTETAEPIKAGLTKAFRSVA